MNKFYALIIVIALLEVARYEYTTNTKDIENYGKIISIFFSLVLAFIVLLGAVAGTFETSIPKEAYPAIITVCIFSFAIDVALLIKMKVLMKP